MLGKGDVALLYKLHASGANTPPNPLIHIGFFPLARVLHSRQPEAMCKRHPQFEKDTS